MPTVEVSDEAYQWIQAFRPLAEAVTDAAMPDNELVTLLVLYGFKAAVADLITRAPEGTNTQALLQLASREPELIARFLADRVALGDDIHRRQ